MEYKNMTKEALAGELSRLRAEYEAMKSRGLKLNMSRGVPCREQIDLTQDMLSVALTPEECFTEGGVDCRNYGGLDGIPEAKRFFGELMGADDDSVIVAGNSSLNLMYDAAARGMLYGIGGNTPWSKQEKVKFLCPVPGYDRHFAVTRSLGIEMINIEMKADGPDMDAVEAYVSSDPQIKGIWCIPRYSNPTGTVYSDEVIRRMASLKPAAPDFRIFWDNAYIVHSVTGEIKPQANILEEAAKAGNPDIVYVFMSTSKISFPGAGVAALASSAANINEIKSIMTIQTIGHDKLNQLRHVRYFKDAEGVARHMARHAELLSPRFAAVERILTERLSGLGIAEWTHPEGGYFVSLDTLDGCAKRVYGLMCELGVTLTQAGATFPYGIDPRDRNLRIAPTFPPIADLELALEALCLCVKLAAAEKMVG